MGKELIGVGRLEFWVCEGDEKGEGGGRNEARGRGRKTNQKLIQCAVDRSRNGRRLCIQSRHKVYHRSLLRRGSDRSKPWFRNYEKGGVVKLKIQNLSQDLIWFMVLLSWLRCSREECNGIKTLKTEIEREQLHSRERRCFIKLLKAEKSRYYGRDKNVCGKAEAMLSGHNCCRLSLHEPIGSSNGNQIHLDSSQLNFLLTHEVLLPFTENNNLLICSNTIRMLDLRPVNITPRLLERIRNLRCDILVRGLNNLCPLSVLMHFCLRV